MSSAEANALRLAVVRFPGLDVARYLQVGHREAAEPGLGFRAAAGRAFVADLAARAGRRTRKRRDRGRVVVRFDLGQDVREFIAVLVAATGARVEAADARTLDHRGIVGVGHHGAFGMRLVRFADHAEQGQRLILAIDSPARVEDFVPAMLGIGLGEHHEFDVGRIAAEPAEVLHEVINLVLGQGQAEFAIGDDQRGASAAEQVDAGQWLRRDMMEQGLRRRDGIQHRLRHAVMEPCRQRRLLSDFARHMKRRAALDAFHRSEAAVLRDVGGFRTPGRNRAEARRHQQQLARRRRRQRRGNAQQVLQPRRFIGIQWRRAFDEIPVLRHQADAGSGIAQGLLQARQARRRKRSRAAQGKEFSHDERTGAGRRREENPRRRIIPRRMCAPGTAPVRNCHVQASLRHCRKTSMRSKPQP